MVHSTTGQSCGAQKLGSCKEIQSIVVVASQKLLSSDIIIYRHIYGVDTVSNVRVRVQYVLADLEPEISNGRSVYDAIISIRLFRHCKSHRDIQLKSDIECHRESTKYCKVLQCKEPGALAGYD